MIDYTKVTRSQVRQVAYQEGYQQGRADEREKMISIVARCIAHNIYNVSEGVNLMNEIKEELEQLKEKSE